MRSPARIDPALLRRGLERGATGSGKTRWLDTLVVDWLAADTIGVTAMLTEVRRIVAARAAGQPTIPDRPIVVIIHDSGLLDQPARAALDDIAASGPTQGIHMRYPDLDHIAIPRDAAIWRIGGRRRGVA